MIAPLKHEIPESLNAIFLPILRTALMLGCEYGCKDAVEVLLKNGADVSLTDGLGHDCAYYARIGDNIDILALIKAAVEDSSKGMKNMAITVCRLFFHLNCVSSHCYVFRNSFLEGSCSPFNKKVINCLFGRGKKAFGFCLVLVKLLR